MTLRDHVAVDDERPGQFWFTSRTHRRRSSSLMWKKANDMDAFPLFDQVHSAALSRISLMGLVRKKRRRKKIECTNSFVTMLRKTDRGQRAMPMRVCFTMRDLCWCLCHDWNAFNTSSKAQLRPKQKSAWTDSYCVRNQIYLSERSCSRSYSVSGASHSKLAAIRAKRNNAHSCSVLLFGRTIFTEYRTCDHVIDNALIASKRALENVRSLAIPSNAFVWAADLTLLDLHLMNSSEMNRARM